jgi:hypothetical protein
MPYKCECCKSEISEKEYPPKVLKLSDGTEVKYCPECFKEREEKKAFIKKPILKEEWEGFWEGFIIDYIMFFQSNVVNYDKDIDDEENEQYLRGIAKGMWAIYNLINQMMVEEKKEGKSNA